ncbi:MAG: DUF2934 domain-containing protein [Methylococcaceae bacterium]|nr:DUF2934 domain-containing protein [Methylococcaceae bacterium]
MAIKKQSKVSKAQQFETTNEKIILDKSERDIWIQEAAFFMAEARGFIPGYEDKDWELAEKKYEDLAA